MAPGWEKAGVDRPDESGGGHLRRGEACVVLPRGTAAGVAPQAEEGRRRPWKTPATLLLPRVSVAVPGHLRRRKCHGLEPGPAGTEPEPSRGGGSRRQTPEHRRPGRTGKSGPLLGLGGAVGVGDGTGSLNQPRGLWVDPGCDRQSLVRKTFVGSHDPSTTF